MSRNILLVLADTAEARNVQSLLAHSRGGPFKVDWVSRCGDAADRLCGPTEGDFAAVVVDLFLPDTQGIETFDKLAGASPYVPMLVLSRWLDEDVARLAVRRGAQDYLLKEQVDGYSLSKALSNMLERSEHSPIRFLTGERAQVTLNSIADAVIGTDVAGNVTYLNRAAESMTGCSRQESFGQPLHQVLRIIDGERREPAVNSEALANRHHENVGRNSNCVLIRRDGHEVAIEYTAAPIHSRHGRVMGTVLVVRDASVARAMALKMSHLAQHDFLTELPNRLLLNDRLTQAIAAARRHRASLAVLFVDVDHFKHVNDSHGHVIGDELLKSIARRLVACVRTSDTVCRQGGDEFVVLLSEVTRSEDALVSSDKILAALSAPHRVEHRELRVTVSVGIGVYPDDATDAETLLTNADRALLHAKAHGRSKRQLFEPGMSARAAELRTSTSKAGSLAGAAEDLKH